MVVDVSCSIKTVFDHIQPTQVYGFIAEAAHKRFRILLWIESLGTISRDCVPDRQLLCQPDVTVKSCYEITYTKASHTIDIANGMWADHCRGVYGAGYSPGVR